MTGCKVLMRSSWCQQKSECTGQLSAAPQQGWAHSKVSGAVSWCVGSCTWLAYLEGSDVLHSDSALVLGAGHAENALSDPQQPRHQTERVRAVNILLVQHKAAILGR